MQLRSCPFLIALLIFGFGSMMHPSELRAEEKWSGVDKAVVEKFAKEHGREAKASLILAAGAVGGFAAGYYWRVLIERKPKSKE